VGPGHSQIFNVTSRAPHVIPGPYPELLASNVEYGLIYTQLEETSHELRMSQNFEDVDAHRICTVIDREGDLSRDDMLGCKSSCLSR